MSLGFVMIPESLKSFIKVLDKMNLLYSINTPVDPVLELAAIVDRVCKSQTPNKALLFTQVMRSTIPVAANLLGSDERMAFALGVESISALVTKFRQDLDSIGGSSSVDALRKLTKQSVISDDLVIKPPWQDDDCTSTGLEILPALKSWPLDGGRYITLGQVFTCSPEGSHSNCGMYRIQIIDSHTALLKCHPGGSAKKHLERWHSENAAMPVVIVLGGPPALTWAAGLSIPEDVSEVDFIHTLTGIRIPLSQAYTTTYKIPAAAEIVVEGVIAPDKEMLEGPFGNHTGMYGAPEPAPVIKITSVMKKADAVYPCTVVGPPPMENSFMARVGQHVLLQLLQFDCPWVSDVHMPIEAIYHRAAMVAIAPDTDVSLAEIQQALLSSQLLRRSRLLILLDEGTKLDDLQHVYWHVINKLNCAQHSDGVIVDARGAKDVSQVVHSPAIAAKITERWSMYGF